LSQNGQRLNRQRSPSQITRDSAEKPAARFVSAARPKVTLARQGQIRIGQRAIETPCVWFGTRPGDLPELWNHLLAPNLIASAASLGKSFLAGGPRLKNLEGWDRIRGNAPLLMDSGGYRLLSDSHFQLSPQHVMRGYRSIRPDFGVILDLPLDPGHSDWSNQKRWLRTLGNTKWMLRNDGLVNLVPVIHGYTARQLRQACDEIAGLTQPTLIGLGSLVPLLKRGLQRRSLLHEWGSVEVYLRYAISYLRERFPISAIHVFGVGSVGTMRMVVAAGADSMDSSSWRMKAAHGALIVPGGNDRFVSPGEGRKGLTKDDRKSLGRCSCPVCRGRTIPSRMFRLDNGRGNTFANRAVHNAYVLHQELATLSAQ
jgi:7-cyano-7-deazaguanine tRNA-ribosyltransferase